MSDPRFLFPIGLTGAIRFNDAAQALEAFADILVSWPVSTAPEDQPTFLTVTGTPSGRYQLSGPRLATEESYGDLADLACAMLVHLFWDTLEAHPDWLCIHGAAAQVAGRLVLFPGIRRAGKSVLTACLAAEGQEIFADDVLPTRIRPDGLLEGIASGISPRLRLPLPKNLPAEIRNKIYDWIGVSGHQYGYASLPDAVQVRHGTAAPIAAVVLLDRVVEGPATLSTAGQAQALRAMIEQNFARTRHAAEILAILESLTSNVPQLQLRYSDSAEAARLLVQEIALLPPSRTKVAAPLTKTSLPPPPLEPPPPLPALEERAPLVRCEVSAVLSAQDEMFVADADGRNIHHLDAMASALWHLLAQPATLAEVVAVFQGAFPEQSADTLSEQISHVIRRMAAGGLLRSGSASA